jgi:hypothetical protein
MSFIGGSLPKIKEDEDEDSWKPGQVGTLGTELNKNINKWISENTWERIPEQYREAIKIGVELGTYSGSHFADGTPKPIKSEWLMNLHPAVLKYKGARSVLSRGFNINPGLVDKGAIVGGTGKTLYNKLNQSTAAHQAVHQAGQNVRRNVDRIKTDVGWAKKQINTLAGNEPNILTKKPNQYINVENVFNDTSKVNTKIRNILANNPGMSYTTARETALLQLKGTHPTGLLKPGHNRSIGAAGINSPLSPSSGHGDIEKRFPNIKATKEKLQKLPLEDSYTKGFKLGKGVGDDIPDPWSPTLALGGKKEFFAKGETKRKLSAKYTTGQEVTPKIKEEWVQSGKATLVNYENALGIKFGPKTPGGQIENHHAGIIRQIFEATNGLTQEFRTKSSEYMSHRLGIELGFSKQNAFPIPIRFHPRIHALINKRISKGPGYNLKGIEEKFNLSPNWQTELSYRQRLPIYNEIISTVADSIKQIDVFWKGLQSRVDLGKGKLLNKEEFMDITLDVLDLDKRLTNAPSPPLMQRKDLGWKATDTATEIINEILENAGKADLTLPIFKPLDKTLTKEALGIIIQKNGWKALHEVVISGQTPATVFKTYGIKPSNKLIKAIQKDNEAYQHMLRSRHQSIPPADSPWDLGRDN